MTAQDYCKRGNAPHKPAFDVLMRCGREMNMARENATLWVALREVQDAANWAYGMVADKLGGAP